jgi:hypothetical protein
MNEMKLCVYCLDTVEFYVCSGCNEYDGVMLVLDAVDYLGEDFPVELRELGYA